MFAKASNLSRLNCPWIAFEGIKLHARCPSSYGKWSKPPTPFHLPFHVVICFHGGLIQGPFWVPPGEKDDYNGSQAALALLTVEAWCPNGPGAEEP